MIEGYCRTNLDDMKYKSGWPTEFVAVPRMGERVMNERGFSLKVVGITHLQRKSVLHPEQFAKPYIEIELHK